jgi:glutamyl-tRNA synthetase
MTKTNQGMGKNATFRLSLVGAKGPHLFDIVELIGKKETSKDSKAIETL